MKQSNSTPRPCLPAGRPLPFPEWVQKTHPDKKFLKMIGALDLLYVLYRMKPKQQTPIAKPKPIIPAMPLKVEEIKKTQRKQRTQKTTRKKTELSIAFKNEPEPIITPVIQEPEQLTPAEPEPLVFEKEKILPLPPSGERGRGLGGGVVKKKKSKNEAWLIEDIDLRKSHAELKTGDLTLSFDVRDADDEEETLIVVNGITWRVMLPSPALNLSKMTQIARVSYGELYVLGRMALGAMSGEAYIAPTEVERVAQLLAKSKDATVTCDVSYCDKSSTSKKRSIHSVSIRFERVA